MPLLKTRPYTLEFSTLEDAVESVLAPSRKFGVHAPVVAAAMRAGKSRSSARPLPFGISLSCDSSHTVDAEPTTNGGTAMRLTIKLSCHDCVLAGIQAAYLVRRFEEGKSHHQTRAKLQEAEKMIEEKDAELERLKAQVRLRLLACAPPSYVGSTLAARFFDTLVLHRCWH